MSTSWDTFDFDAWVELYKTDPFAFETRRQATLLIEAARCGTAARETAAMLIAQKPSRDKQVRLEGALNQLTRSMAVLAIHLHELSRTLKKTQALAHAGPHPVLPASSSANQHTDPARTQG